MGAEVNGQQVGDYISLSANILSGNRVEKKQHAYSHGLLPLVQSGVASLGLQDYDGVTM